MTATLSNEASKNDDVNILFISPSSMPLFEQEALLEHRATEIVPKFETPTGLIELASFIRNKLDYVNFALLDYAKDIFLHHRSIANHQPIAVGDFYKNKLDEVAFVPDIVGISILFSSSYLSSLKIVECIREKWPKTIITLGGGHATFYHDLIFQDSDEVDFVFVGEAELGFLEFVKSYYLKRKKTTADIRGVYNRDKIESDRKKGIVKGEFCDLLLDLDEIGLPAYDLLDMEVYRNFSNSMKDGAIGVMTERGCPFKCTYCASMIIHGSKIRSKSNERIISDLLYLRDDCGFSNILIWDDLLAAKKKKFKELVKKIVEDGVNKGLLFSMPSGLSVRIINYELIDTICSLEFDYIRIMIESGSKYSQEHLIKKKVDLDKARDLISYARTKGVKVETNILFGFPGETKELMQETIDYINTIDIDWIQVFAVLPLPGTEMFSQFVQKGVIDPDRFDWDTCGYRSRGFDTEEISSRDLTDLVYDVNMYTNFFGNRNILNGRFERAIAYFTDMVLDKYPFHIPALYMRSNAYRMIGDESRAMKDVEMCVYQISHSPEALKLWNRYGSEMDSLNEYLDRELVAAVMPAPPAVSMGFKL